jgi:tetratricopeptide (TPR) repeat protein
MEPRRSLDGAMRVWRSILAHAGALLALGGLLVVALGIVVAGISPLTVLYKAADDYEDYEERQELVDDHVELGNKLLNVEQPRAARVEFEAALALDESDPDATLGLVKTRVFEPVEGDDLDPEVSHKRLTHLVLTRPEDANARAYRGDSWVRFGLYRMAFGEYTRSVRRDAKIAHGYSGQGLVYAVRGKPEKALSRFKRALKISAHSTRYANNYAYQLTRLGHYQTAILKYENLLEVDPGSLLPYYGLGNANRLSRHLSRARDVQTALVELIADRRVANLPRNSGVWYFHTIAAHESWPDHEKPLAQLVTTGQKELYAWLSLALTEAADGQQAKARRYLQEARALDLDPTKVVAPLAIACFDVQQLSQKPRVLATSEADAFVAALERAFQQPACALMTQPQSLKPEPRLQRAGQLIIRKSGCQTCRATQATAANCLLSVERR